MKKNLVIVLACMLAAVGCRDSGSPHKDGSHGHPHPHGGEEKDHAHEEAHNHNQPPPHGGTVVKIDDHKFNLELVQDTEAGKFQAYVLDAHMEYVAVPETSFALVANVNGKDEYPSFERVTTGAGASPEKSSLFEAKADWIKSTTRFDGLIPSITLGGKTFTNVLFTFPKSSAKAP